MFKKLPKIITLFFLIIFLLQIAGLVFLLMVPETGQAEFKKAVFEPQIALKGVGTGSTIGNYIEAIYKYAIGIVGILATVVMMWGGVIWITAGGNTERISSAKSWISASLTGLVLALASYTILYTINPNLVKFKPLVIPSVKETKGSSGWYFDAYNYSDLTNYTVGPFTSESTCEDSRKKEGDKFYVSANYPCYEIFVENK